MILKPVFKNYFIRFLHSSFFDEVAQLECFSGECLWSKNDISDMMNKYKYGGYVVKFQNAAIGYMVYEKCPKSVTVLNVVIHPDHRRKGLGTILLNKLKDFDLMNADVRETNYRAHAFLKDYGFVAKVIKKGEHEDNYCFKKEKEKENEKENDDFCNRTSWNGISSRS